MNTTTSYQIVQSQLTDLDFACQLFNDAIAYQKRKGYPEYRCDDRVLQKMDIENGQHYKVVVQDEIAAIFTMWYSDEKIWRHRDKNKSIYLHRIVTNQKFKGQKLLEKIIDWVVVYAQSIDRTTIRIDTWDNNPSLVQYYMKHGFDLVEHFQIPDTEDMPENCRGNAVVLMEYKVSKKT